MEQNSTPTEHYTESEWGRIGCATLPAERARSRHLLNTATKGNPVVGGKTVKGYN